MSRTNVSIGKHVQLSGRRSIFIDVGTTIGDYSWLNVCVPDEKIRLRIGRCVLIGRQSLLSTGGHLEIGDFCLFGPRVTIADADHIYADPNQPVIQQGATLGRSIIIEENCWLGTNVVVTGNVTIGRGSVVAANTTVTKNVPPFSVVAGIPSKVIKMFNAQTKQWDRIKSEDDYLQILETNKETGLPNREQYRSILLTNAKITKIDASFGGPHMNLWLFFRDLLRRLLRK